MDIPYLGRSFVLCQTLAAACALWPVATAIAQPIASISSPDYVSPLRGYKTYTAPEPIDWRKANQTVDAIGGWRAYAREPKPKNEGGKP